MSPAPRAGLADNPAAPPSGTALVALAELADPGSRGFSWRIGEALFNGFVVRRGDEAFGYVDHCPHAGFPLAMMQHRYLTRDGRAILCSAHGALFGVADGGVLAGPAIRALTPWPVRVGADGMVRVA